MLNAGLFYLFETLGEMSEADFYRQALDECAFGEQLGFTAACPAEHHFSEHYGIMPRVELFLAMVAARTERMKLWPMVIVAPLSDPIRLAEDCALLDNFSHGRMVFSVGSGYRSYEFKPFAREITENTDRLREVVELTLKLWNGEPVRHEGRFYKVDGPAAQPRPFRRPHPPVYVTTTRDDQIRWAAERGFGVVPAAGFNAETLAHDFRRHAEHARAAGKPTMDVRPFFKWIYVHEDHRTGVEEGMSYILKTLMAFAQGGGRLFTTLMGKSLKTAWQGDVERPAWLTERVEEIMAAGVTYDDMVKAGWTPFLCGSPEHVTEQLKPFVEAGGNFFIGGFKCGSMPEEKVRSSMRLFAERVMPNL